METKQIVIDLTVSRIIELHRDSFSETENDILKKILPSIERRPLLTPLNYNNQPQALLVGNLQSDHAEFFISSPTHKKDVYALGSITTNGFVVIKGSRVSKAITPKMPQYYLRLREKLFAEGIIDSHTRLFMQDYEFTAISAASSVILGVSSDGVRDWIPKVQVSEFDLD